MTTSEDVGNVVVGVFGGRPVFLKDVATISDGAEEPADYVMFGHGAGETHEAKNEQKATGIEPAVTIAVSNEKARMRSIFRIKFWKG